MITEEEKREIEEKAEKEKKVLPWWKNLSPMVLGVAGIAGFLVLKSMVTDVENKNTYLFYMAGLIFVIYLLSQTAKAREDVMVTPREAELLVERECERKRRWGQFGPMAKYEIGPVSNLMHRDAKGIYYDVAVVVTSPYDRPRDYVATVMAKGVERGFVTLTEGIGSMTGREKPQEKTLIPDWAKRIGPATVLEKMMFREK